MAIGKFSTTTEEDYVICQSKITEQEVKLSGMICPYEGFKKHGSKGYQNSGKCVSCDLKDRFILMGNYSSF